MRPEVLSGQEVASQTTMNLNIRLKFFINTSDNNIIYLCMYILSPWSIYLSIKEESYDDFAAGYRKYWEAQQADKKAKMSAADEIEDMFDEAEYARYNIR